MKDMPFDTRKLWKNMLDTHAIKMQIMLDQYENSNETDHLLLLNTLLDFESLPSRILPQLLKVNVAHGNVTVEFDPAMKLDDIIIDLGPAIAQPSLHTASFLVNTNASLISPSKISPTMILTLLTELIWLLFAMLLPFSQKVTERRQIKYSLVSAQRLALKPLLMHCKSYKYNCTHHCCIKTPALPGDIAQVDSNFSASDLYKCNLKKAAHKGTARGFYG
jgi:hypothetical protein